MAGRIHKLRQRAADLTKEGEELFALAAKEDRSLNDAERGRDDEIEAELGQVKIDIAAEERQLERERGMDRISQLPGVDVDAPQDAPPDAQQGFSRFGEMLQAVAAAHPERGGVVDQRLRIGAAAQGVQQAVPSEGGFLVSPSFSDSIWDGMNQAPDSLLARTDQYTVQGDSLTFKANSETSRATGSRYGGVRGYWIKEAAQITKSQPKFRDLKLEPQELAVLIYVTDKMLRNSPVALEQYVNRAGIEEINFLTGDAIINGDGSGKPLGILNSGGIVEVAKETGQLAATIVAENISKMWARMHARSRANSVWLYNGDIMPQLDQLSYAVGTSGQLIYMPPGGLSGAPYSTLLGRPMVETEYNATLGTAGDLILADMAGYATGIKGGILSAMSMHLRFDYAETAFRLMFEVDGQTWLNSAITPFKGTNTRSPFISLATRA